MKNAINFAVLFLLVIGLAEAGSYGALHVLGESGKSFSEIYDPTGNTARVKGVCDDYIQILELNPYLAYRRNKQCAGRSYRINDLGMLNQDADLQHERFYSIGIFGGSVATLFAGAKSAPQIEEILNNCFTSKSGRPFRVLNFAEGGWKQPQQVIALVLYGDYINAAISIEGFNERYWLKPGISFDIITPPNIYSSLIDDGFFAKCYFLLPKLESLSISNSNTVRLFTLLFRKYLEKKGLKSYSKLMEEYAMPSDLNAHSINVKRYIGFVKSFDAVANAKDIYSLFVLQPTPMHKKLSNSEAKVVVPLDYEQQYQEITSVMEQNASRFLNLSDLFSGYEKTIFSDQIHFVPLNENGKSFGNYIMSIEIIRRLVRDDIVLLKSNSDNCVASLQPQ
jgi:hypothetical protein